MDSARSARHSLAVATIVGLIALSCAAAVGGGTGPSPGNTAASGASSLLTKLPQPQLPKFPVIYTYGKHRSPRPPTTNPPTSPGNKQQQSQRPPQQQLSQQPSKPQPQQPSKPQPQQSSKPQKRPQKPTVDERPGGRDPYQSSANASVTTSPRPKLETTTQDRAIITVPLKACPDGQRMGPDRNCRPDFPDPEGDQSK
ncbi:pollen-specific leucine-rich repeat extensin-like protein 2 [Myzus persicae]|uniref:pollen-specific leucine-rich repeat extensin-like protein 2 n=1 Tax=Myzus persicae TaxID=13164 RepID=UPI000B9395CA|nr:pollen-specific leucine-rich repeat extensin-like protein 2 [Myzus persicae]